MANDILLNSGSGGSTLATDEAAGGEHYQQIKVIDGTADSTTEVQAGAGTAANALRVELPTDGTGVVGLNAGSNTIGKVDLADAATTSGSLAKAEDQAHVSADVGVMALAVRQATPADTSGSDGDYEPLKVDNGRLWASVQGDSAHDAAVSGNPFLQAGKSIETDGTAAGAVTAEGDTATLLTDMIGRLLVSQTHPNLWSGTANTSSAETAEVVAAPGAGLSLYVTEIMVSALTAQTIKIVEDAGGTPVDIVEIMYLPANGTVTMSLSTPIRVTANTNLGYTTTAAVATSIFFSGYTAQ
jgi:hypothetical protein